MASFKTFFSNRQTRLSVYTVLAVVIGLFGGLVVKALFWPDGQIDVQVVRFVSLPGAAYLRLLILLIVPMLITSLSTSFLTNNVEERATQMELGLGSNGDKEHSKDGQEGGIETKRLITATCLTFLCFSLFASLSGCTLVAIVGPGQVGGFLLPVTNITGFNQVEPSIGSRMNSIKHRHMRLDTIYNMILNIFADNPIAPLFMSSFVKTDLEWPEDESLLNDVNFEPSVSYSQHRSFKCNLLSTCVLSLCLGVILHQLGPEKTRIFRSILNETDIIVRHFMQLLLRAMPLGLFCLMFSEGLKMKSVMGVVEKLASFYATVFSSFLILWLVFYPVVYFVFTRGNCFRLYGQVFPAMVVAFGSTSSAITMPETMQCMESAGRVPQRILQTVLPLGMTVHMNGTAMYYPMVALFVAQLKGVPLDASSVIVISLFSVLMSAGMPPTPASGGATAIVHHLTFASVLGVENVQDILVYILAFEVFWERVRTMTNITGDAVAASVIHRIVLATPARSS